MKFASLHGPLHTLLKEPLAISPEQTIQDASELLANNPGGVVVIVEPESRKPLGVLGLQDLAVAFSKGVTSDALALSHSSLPKFMLTWRQNAYQALLFMEMYGVSESLVVDAGGRLVGTVSKEAALSAERGGITNLVSALRNAVTMDQLVSVSGDIRNHAIQQSNSGVSGSVMTAQISSLNDHLTSKVVELALMETPVPQIPWAWLSFGSEGRFEQTISTDQDNGIVFLCPSTETEKHRVQFLLMAANVNQKLSECGFPLCKGNIMASNPELCLSLDEWKSKFMTMMTRNTPDDILNATILFDMRPVHGDFSLGEELFDWLVQNVKENELFLRHMADSALKAEAPLGFFKDFQFDSKEFPGTVELKAFGTRVFVDAARIFAYKHGIRSTSTDERMQHVKNAGGLRGEDIEALSQAFDFIQRIRLRLHGEGNGNRLDPKTLSSFERLMLKEAFKQAKKFQSVLRTSYHL